MNKDTLKLLINAIYMWGKLEKDRNLTVKVYSNIIIEMLEELVDSSEGDIDLLKYQIKQLKDE